MYMPDVLLSSSLIADKMNLCSRCYQQMATLAGTIRESEVLAYLLEQAGFATVDDVKRVMAFKLAKAGELRWEVAAA